MEDETEKEIKSFSVPSPPSQGERIGSFFGGIILFLLLYILIRIAVWQIFGLIVLFKKSL